MYIKNGSKQYQVSGANFATQLSWSGLTDIQVPVSGTIKTYTDDGFELRSDSVSDWEHQWLENGTLVLSHIEKPIDPPVPEPTPSELREHEYQTRLCIEWYDDMITIDRANELWVKYTAEGRDMSALSDEIHYQKEIIRQEYPDEPTRRTVDEILAELQGKSR